MTVERPRDSAHVWMVNATDQPVDVYVNHADEPAITDLKSLEIGPQFQVDGTGSTPYGTYTFSARPKADPTAPVLAAASIAFDRGNSFSAVLHLTPDGDHQLAIYANDFSPEGDARMTVRQCARPAEIAWRIAPKDVKPEIPVDERSGTLTNRQWQTALDVVQNDYRFEALVDGRVVAMHPDLELEHEKDRTVYVVGDPRPTADPTTLRRHVLEQEFQLPLGLARADRVTAPDDPVSTTDENAPIAFGCEPLEVWQTNVASTQVSAVDPDGVVTNLSIDHVDPPVGGIVVPEHGVAPAPCIGGQALATVEVQEDVPGGEYDVTMVANRGSWGHHATCILHVAVGPITLDRLHDVVRFYHGLGDLQDGFADALRDLLDQAQAHLDAGETSLACLDLKDALDQLGTEKGKAISVRGHDHLDRETLALRSNLGCG